MLPRAIRSGITLASLLATANAKHIRERRKGIDWGTCGRWTRCRQWDTPPKEWFQHQVYATHFVHRSWCVLKLQKRIRSHDDGRQIKHWRTLSVADDTFWLYDRPSTIDCFVLFPHLVQHLSIPSRSLVPIPKGNIQDVFRSPNCLHVLELYCRRYETGTDASFS